MIQIEPNGVGVRFTANCQNKFYIQVRIQKPVQLKSSLEELNEYLVINKQGDQFNQRARDAVYDK